MLYLQRASAGSGKTYTLARQYIKNLITIAPEGGRLRLRTPAEARDAASHIMAVTFTNKATAEMKLRIIDRLAALAGGDPSDTCDYLAYFCSMLGAEPDAVRRVCAVALSALLNNYSDFQVSTIDSFFQTILRTFAYETDLNDTYQVELDNRLLAEAGVDSTLREVDSGAPPAELLYWLDRIIDDTLDKGYGWNVFMRSGSSYSMYSAMLDVASRMEPEAYKMIAPQMKAYFEEHPDYHIIFGKLEERYKELGRSVARSLGVAADTVADAFDSEGLDVAECGMQYLASHLRKVSGVSDEAFASGPAFKYQANVSRIQKNPASVFGSKPECRLLKKDSALVEHISEVVLGFYAEVDRWCQTVESADFKAWQAYRSNMAYLGLQQAIARHSRHFAEANNLVPLSDTNSLLRRVIGDDDTPFIYERIGYRLNHYLIDEFQDTSAMQWANLRPLLAESESRGHDNLIIGDAKQSIYRFRNADASLITDVVPGQFAGCKIAGYAPSENTNHRSTRNVVEFNNLFFSRLSGRIDADGRTISFSNLYGNVVQPVAHPARTGYVGVIFVDGSLKDEFDDVPQSLPHLRMLGPMIMDMVRRGFRLKDIAVLVESHAQARAVINEVMLFNASLPSGTPPVEFVSSDSLLVSGSKAVKIVLSALEVIRGGRIPDSSGKDDVLPEGRVRNSSAVADIGANFNFFAMSHPEMSLSEAMRAFMDGAGSRLPVDQMLGEMQSVALPALVEGIIEAFVPMELCVSDAAFLAAFQDAVTDYCAVYPADTASFLRWWEHQSRSLTIDSPEGTDAVNILTMHSSKGLEYQCVILPFGGLSLEAAQSPAQSRGEWLWVRPSLELADGLPLPPYVPVVAKASLEGTPHEAEYRHYRDLYTMDKLNQAYVAFTRAVSELYVFAPLNRGGRAGQGLTLADELYDFAMAVESGDMPCDDYMPDAPLFVCSLPEESGRDGDMDAADEVADRYAATPGIIGRLDYGKPLQGFSAVDDCRSAVPVERYVSRGVPAFLKYTEADAPSAGTEDPDPRSDGNIMHEILAGVTVASGLHRAVAGLVARGVIDSREADDAERRISLALAQPVAARWFDGSMRVACERPVLKAGERDRRPDRILFDDARRHAVVIDYKFGSLDESAHDSTAARYRRQVSSYVSLLIESGACDTAEGWIWYVDRAEAVRVDV